MKNNGVRRYSNSICGSLFTVSRSPCDQFQVNAETSIDRLATTPVAKSKWDFIPKTEDKKWEKELVCDDA